jgi:hypothetical protein
MVLAVGLSNGGTEDDALDVVLSTYQCVPTHDRYALTGVENAVRDTYGKHEMDAVSMTDRLAPQNNRCRRLSRGV